MKVAGELSIFNDDRILCFDAFVIKGKISHGISCNRFVASISHSYQRASDDFANFSGSNATSFYKVSLYRVANGFVAQETYDRRSENAFFAAALRILRIQKIDGCFCDIVDHVSKGRMAKEARPSTTDPRPATSGGSLAVFFCDGR